MENGELQEELLTIYWAGIIPLTSFRNNRFLPSQKYDFIRNPMSFFRLTKNGIPHKFSFAVRAAEVKILLNDAVL